MMPLEEQFAADIKDLIDSGAGMPFVFNPGEAFMLLAVLQLALRHPGLDGAAGKFARELAKNIEQRLCVTPALKEVARRGWEPPSWNIEGTPLGEAFRKHLDEGYRCPKCGKVSHHPEDLKHRYCAACHEFEKSDWRG